MVLTPLKLSATFFALAGAGFCLRSSLPTQTAAQSDPVRIHMPTSAAIKGELLIKNSFTYPMPVTAQIRFNPPLPGKHWIEAEWIRPDGRLQETTRLHLDLGPEGNKTANLWLQFQEASALDNLRFGMGEEKQDEEKDYIGDWMLKVRCDGQRVATTGFRIVAAAN